MAQKETVNTFTGGMVMDTHPLTTPNNVLTNCLNGTLVTFNGNEMILQNDLGNAKIESKKNGDCVKLPEGFVPVGTTELGGIIYISSFNPETKQCQIGCFPSPERNIEPDIEKQPQGFNVSSLILTVNSKTYTGGEIYPLIKGGVRIDLTTEELHSGDYYTINVTDGTIPNDALYEFKLISVSEDGTIMDLNFIGFGLKQYYTAPNAGKLALLISPKKLSSFSCTYTDLKQNGTYTSSDDVCDYIEVDSVPTEYKGEHVVVYDWDYYQLSENQFASSTFNSNLEYDTIDYLLYNNDSLIRYTDSSNVTKDYILVNNIFTTGNLDTALIQGKTQLVITVLYFQANSKYYELQGTTFVEVASNNLSYENYPNLTTYYSSDYYLSYTANDSTTNFILDTTSNLFISTGLDNKTRIILKNPQFKVRKNGSQYVHKYEWVPGGWDSTLVCKWNDLDKEENKSVLLSGIVIDDLYPVTASDGNSKEITVTNQTPVNNIIKLKVYPVINLDISNKGYIEELVQTVILDTTLKAGQVKLTMWKYYYDNDIVNLQYGFAGLLDLKKQINKITISALEYKQYDQGTTDHNEIILIELKDRDSYFGSFYNQIEVGKQLLPNKLYAITIKIETNYSDPIYEYRWLYTNDVFNNKFNSPVLDYNEEKIVLSNLKCNIKIGGDNDYAQEVTDLDPQYLSVEATTEETINGGDYTSYGYTKNTIDDEIPYEFTYDTGNELFKLDLNVSLKSEITEIKTNGITTPYNYTEKEDLVLNSYPGLKQESGIGTSIWSSAYRYQYYTDYVGIEDWDNENIHFKGRVYNKIRGKVTTADIEGKEIYAPLVYDTNTARKFNLEYKNGSIVPIYYLCIETYPPLSVRKHGTWFTSECHDWIKGRLSEFRIKLTKQSDKIKLKYENSFEDINTNLCCAIDTSGDFDKGTSINLNNSNTWNQGTALHKKVINNLSEFGITKCTIIPIIFTKLNGTLRNVQYSRNGNDDWMDSSGDTLQDIKLYINNLDKDGSGKTMPISRNGNDKGVMEFDNSYYHATLGLINESGDLYISTNNYILITPTNNKYDTLSKKIFNLLSLVYTSVGKNENYSVYCLTDYDYQQDYQAKVNISGKIKTKITSHQIVANYTDNFESSSVNNFEKWNFNNLMIEDSDSLLSDFNCYKLFEILQLLVQQYEDQTYSKVKTRLEGRGEGTVISCFRDHSIATPDSSAIYYVVNNYKLTPIDGSFNIYYNISGDVTLNPDGTFLATYNTASFSYGFLTFNQTKSLLQYDQSLGGLGYEIKINNEVGDPGDGRNREGHSATITNTINKGL